MDVKDFHLKTKWFWLFLLTILGGIWAEVLMLCQHSNSDYRKEVLTLQLEISGYSYWQCVTPRPFPLYRSRVLNVLWTAGLPPAVLVGSQPPFGVFPLCVSQPQHWAADSKDISQSPQGTRCPPSSRSARAPDLVCPTALPHPAPSGCVERRAKEKERGVEAANCVRFYLLFKKKFFFPPFQVCQSLKLKHRQYRVIKPNHVVILSSSWNGIFCPHKKNPTL